MATELVTKLGFFNEEKHLKIFYASLMEDLVFFLFFLRENNNCITRKLSLFLGGGGGWVWFFFWCKFQYIEVGFVFRFIQGRKGVSHIRFLPT